MTEAPLWPDEDVNEVVEADWGAETTAFERVRNIVKRACESGVDGDRRRDRGVSGPSFPACESESTYCTNRWVYNTRGQCYAGFIDAWYRFDLARILPDTGDGGEMLERTDESAVGMHHE